MASAVKSPTRPPGIVKVLLGTLAVVGVLLIGAVVHYERLAATEDPRVKEARTLLQAFDDTLEQGNYDASLALLEAADRIYRDTPGYRESFERGVVENNRATVHLLRAETALLAEDEVPEQQLQESLETAADHARRAVEWYRRWLRDYGSLSPEDLRRRIAPTFDSAHPSLQDVDLEAVIDKRVEDVVLAQLETRRRLSVAYTNLGVIQRYRGRLDEARSLYEHALALWDRNYTAADNLNRLLDRPRERRPVLEQLFPPDRTDPSGAN